MLAPRLLLPTAALALAGCAFFASLTADTQAQAQADAEAEARRQAQEAARQQEQADLQLAAELDSLRAAALAEGASLRDAASYVERYGAALRAGAVERGRVPASHGDEAWAALDAQAARIGEGKDPEARRDRASIEAARGALRFDQGRLDEATAHFLAAVELEPSYELFALLLSLPKSPTSDAALLQACPQVRPAIASEQLPDFVALCLDAAAGDRGRLSWKSAKADLKAHDVEMAHRAEQERLRQEEEARLAAAEAERAAAAAAQTQLWASAAVFAAGRCRFSNCLTDGWEASTDQGTVTTTCRFSNCLKDGWETRFPDGSSATTSCRFSDCMKDGWETRFPDGSSATTSCRFSNCPVDGWETRFPDGSSVTTSCRFQDCFKDGWETRMPSGTVTCTCRFSDCLKDGTECR
ncbi:MAG: hypothetical protein R6X02_29770 [Enhygromyxa sp.]